MNLFSQIWQRILGLFGKRPLDRQTESDNMKYTDDYESTTRISFDAIFATALTTRSVSDSTIKITDMSGNVSRRTEWLAAVLEKVWSKNKDTVSQALGKGGKVLIPYITDGKGYVDIVDQSRMRISSMRGDEIASATIMAEHAKVNGNTYYRFVDYTLEGTTHTILTRATTENGAEVSLDTVAAWANIVPEIVIENVEHILLGYLKCPRDNRKDVQVYGVPITYGCDQTKRDLYECLEDIRREYKTKKAFVGADSRLFGKDNHMPDEGLFKKFENANGLTGQSFWEVFDPAIRDSSYFARLNQLSAQLESEVGTSPGILTEPRTANATATEIKQANFGTFTMIDSIRTNIETAYGQLAYALDVLCEYFSITPAGARGDFTIAYDWDMSLLESTSETWAQMKDGYSMRVISKAELRAWLTGESLDDAQEKIDEIAKTDPSMQDLIGNAE